MPAYENHLPRLGDKQRIILGRWLVEAQGDARDDVRAALSAGEDIADDLVLASSALAAVEDADSSDAEARAAVLRATVQLLSEDSLRLAVVFEHLWNCAVTLGL